MIEILTLTERGRWLESWSRTGREPFAHPDFVALFGGEKSAPIAVRWTSDGVEVLLPLLLRPILEPVAPPGWRDAVSPYGYGGPFAQGDPEWRKFYGDLLRWMGQAHILSGFLRASLDHDAWDAEGIDGYVPVVLARNVVVDVTRDEDDQWRSYAHKVRKNVGKALRAGLTVEVVEDEVDTAGLAEVYLTTMDRRGAATKYRFDEAFFRALLSIPGAAVVADVRAQDGTLASTEVVLTSDRHLYSFLGGTREEFFPHAPNDLLKTAVIDFGRRTGRTAYVLGGGLEDGDGIFRYKRSFDESGVVPFVGVRLVADPQAYAAACQRVGADLGLGFFPAYRAGQMGSIV